MAKSPPMSEIFEAMAKGVIEPYMTGLSSSQSFDRACEQAAMFRAIAAVYRKYEQAHPDRTEGGDAEDG